MQPPFHSHITQTQEEFLQDRISTTRGMLFDDTLEKSGYTREMLYERLLAFEEALNALNFERWQNEKAKTAKLTLDLESVKKERDNINDTKNRHIETSKMLNEQLEIESARLTGIINERDEEIKALNNNLSTLNDALANKQVESKRDH